MQENSSEETTPTSNQSYFLDSGSIFSAGAQLFREHFSTLFPLVALLGFPLPAILSYYIQQQTATPTSQFVGTFLPVFVLLNFIQGFLSIWLTSSFIIAVEKLHDNKPITFTQALVEGKEVVGSLILTSVIRTILVLALMLLFIIPGVVFSMYWAFSNHFVILRRRSGWDALKESKKLVQGRAWKVFSTLFMIGLPFLVIIFAASFSSTFLRSVTSPIFVSLATQLLYLIIGYIQLTCITIYFLHLEKSPLNSEAAVVPIDPVKQDSIFARNNRIVMTILVAIMLSLAFGLWEWEKNKNDILNFFGSTIRGDHPYENSQPVDLRATLPPISTFPPQTEAPSCLPVNERLGIKNQDVEMVLMNKTKEKIDASISKTTVEYEYHSTYELTLDAALSPKHSYTVWVLTVANDEICDARLVTVIKPKDIKQTDDKRAQYHLDTSYYSDDNQVFAITMDGKTAMDKKNLILVGSFGRKTWL
jgi:hypothetical protein